jgi:hypothetical protein
MNMKRHRQLSPPPFMCARLHPSRTNSTWSIQLTYVTTDKDVGSLEVITLFNFYHLSSIIKIQLIHRLFGYSKKLLQSKQRKWYPDCERWVGTETAVTAERYYTIICIQWLGTAPKPWDVIRSCDLRKYERRSVSTWWPWTSLEILPTTELLQAT